MAMEEGDELGREIGKREVVRGARKATLRGGKVSRVRPEGSMEVPTEAPEHMLEEHESWGSRWIGPDSDRGNAGGCGLLVFGFGGPLRTVCGSQLLAQGRRGSG